MRWRFGGGAATWRVAKSLVTLLTYIDSLWPKRHPADGTVGDTSHQARPSDHNPDRARVVKAGDVGIWSVKQGNQLVGALVGSRDPRIKYIIFNRRIWRSYPKPGIPSWTPAPYTGPNPHKSHVHISVSNDPVLYDDPSPWNVDLTNDEEDEMALKNGDTGNAVTYFQVALLERRPDSLPQYGADGSFGDEMEAAVKAYQVDANLEPTGRIDGVTAFLLGRYHPEFDVG